MKKLISVLIIATLLLSSATIGVFAVSNNNIVSSAEGETTESTVKHKKAYVVNMPVMFNYDNTDKVADADLTEYAWDGDDYLYTPTTGDGSLRCTINGTNDKHLSWSKDEYKDVDGNVVGIVPAFGASTSNNWSENAAIEIITRIKDYTDVTLSFEMGATKKGPANYRVYAMAGGEEMVYEIGKFSLAKNKTMYKEEFSLAGLQGKDIIKVYIGLDDTKSIGGDDLSVNPTGGEMAINNIAVTGKEIETTTSTTTVTESTTESTTVSATDDTKTTESEIVPTKPTVNVVKVTKVSLNTYTKNLNVGKTYTLKATCKPDNADIKSVSWSSSNKKVATVAQSGKVTAKAKGTSYITATSRDGSKKSAKCKITVKQPVKKVKLSATKKTLKVNKSFKLTATVTPVTANKLTVKWTYNKKMLKVKNQNIKCINKSMVKVTAKKKGTSTIKATATDGSKKSAKCKVTVKK